MVNKKIMKLTDNEKKYWFNIVTHEAVESILKRRLENDQLSSVFDTAQAFNPNGTVPRYVSDRVSQIIWYLYSRGQIKKIRKDVTSNPDVRAGKKWHYKYSPNPRKDWLSLVPRRNRAKTNHKYKTRAYALDQLRYFKELTNYAKNGDTFSFRQAFRDITGLEGSASEVKNPKIYRTYQALYCTMKYLQKHGYLRRINKGDKFIYLTATKKMLNLKTVAEKPLTKVFLPPKLEKVFVPQITKPVRVEVEVLNSNLSDKAKVTVLKNLMGDE